MNTVKSFINNDAHRIRIVCQRVLSRQTRTASAVSIYMSSRPSPEAVFDRQSSVQHKRTQHSPIVYIIFLSKTIRY